MFDSDWNATTPVFCGTIGPKMVAWQCMCSGVYLIILCRELASCMLYTGSDWNRRHPTENTSGSWFLSVFRCHRCFFSRNCWYPIASSDGKRPPTRSGRDGSKWSTHSCGTPLSTSLRYAPGRNPSSASRVASGIRSSSRRVLAIWSCISPLTRSKYDAGSSSSAAPFAPRPNPPRASSPSPPSPPSARGASFFAIFASRRRRADDVDAPESESSSSSSTSSSSDAPPRRLRLRLRRRTPRFFLPLGPRERLPGLQIFEVAVHVPVAPFAGVLGPGTAPVGPAPSLGFAADRSAAAAQSPVTNRLRSSGSSRSSAARTSPANLDASNASPSALRAAWASPGRLNNSSSGVGVATPSVFVVVVVVVFVVHHLRERFVLARFERLVPPEEPPRRDFHAAAPAPSPSSSFASGSYPRSSSLSASS